MKILLVVPSLNVPIFKGLARHSLELVKGLEKIVDLEIYEVHNPNINHFKNFTTVPFKQLISKADVCHVMVPESGLISFLKGKNMVVTFNDFHISRLEGILNFKNKLLLNTYVNLTWNLAAKAGNLICISTQTAKELKYYFKRDSVVINPPIDEKFKPINVIKDKTTIGFFANFSERKRVNIAIDVFKILKSKLDCKLILAGGYLNSMFQRNLDVEEMIKGLSDIEFLGYIPEKAIVKLYNSFDFFIFPSIFEGFGIPILEAQKCGIPTFVMSDSIIPIEAKKMAIECISPNDMAMKILNLFNNRDEYRKNSERSRQYANKFNSKRFIEKHLSIYEKISSTRRSR